MNKVQTRKSLQGSIRRVAVVSVVLLLALTMAASAATITTDKADYSSGEVVTMTGTQIPSESTIIVTRPDGSTHSSETLSLSPFPGFISVSNSGGYLVSALYQLNGIPGTYTVEVYNGGNVIAQTTFTDDNTRIISLMPSSGNLGSSIDISAVLEYVLIPGQNPTYAALPNKLVYFRFADTDTAFGTGNWEPASGSLTDNNGKATLTTTVPLTNNQYLCAKYLGESTSQFHYGSSTQCVPFTTGGQAIPEFPTVALPIAAVIGMVFFFQNRKKKEE